MSLPTPSIEELPETTRTKLRSTQILTSLPQIVSELVQNSLDAGAAHIEVGVDCESWECWVKDDGVGMSKEGMSLLGQGLEEGRYNSSKAYNPASLDDVSTFGFRGEALASAADITCLEISSRTKRSRESWSIILKNGRSLYAGPSTRWRRESAGTVVCLRDIFFNLPIRRLSHPPAPRTFEIIRKEIETLAYVFPNVSFSLDDLHKQSKVLNIPKVRSPVVSAVPSIRTPIQDIHASGRIPSYQWQSAGLDINHHPLAPCHLQRSIEIKFANSSFAKHAFDEGGETSLPRSTVRRSPRKAERKPVYVLDLTIPPRHVDNCLEPNKIAVHFTNDEAVSTFLDSVITQFLVRHGFSSQARWTQDDLPSPRKKMRLDDALIMKRNGSLPSTVHIPHADDTHSAPFSRPTSAPPLYITHDVYDELIWTDPKTGVTYLVDTRTGNSYPRNPMHRVLDDEDGEARPNRRTIVDPDWLKDTKASRPAADKEPTPQWILDALQPEIKAVSMDPLIKAQNNSEPTPSRHAHSASRFFHQCGSTATPHEPSLSARFRRGDLRCAKVISQLDKKFIVCTIDSPGAVEGEDDPPGRRDSKKSPHRALVVVDQHAASERIRVERFFKELCEGFLAGEGTAAVRTVLLMPPKPVLLTRREAELLGGREDVRAVLRRWGFYVESGAAVGTPGDDAAYEQVMVGSVPKIASEKLLMGNELRDLLKGYLAAIEVDDITLPDLSQQLDADPGDIFYWQKALRWCPRELVDLINSRACRGAIMFNDALTLDQCERLILQLADTAFPFQCAHGR
ncbi:hypothetical protein FA95DRAFT_1480918 [Auriscalpium vulgare]|uniref:Uncharacterized protein n=1 Tax=Auriscalpium vulgare TaxID=40419 RepID=A0ACB8SCT6_9AGAM|nr:hypothetical protein FA95DRAFT_1480918 [Auriscalpium vulgare]